MRGIPLRSIALQIVVDPRAVKAVDQPCRVDQEDPLLFHLLLLCR